MDLTTLLTGGALVGVLAGFWTKIKQWLVFMFSMAIETVDIYDLRSAQILFDYMVSNCKKSKLYTRTFMSIVAYDHSKGSVYRDAPAEVLGFSSMLFWLGNTPVLFVRDSKEPSKGQGNAGGRGEASGESSENAPKISAKIRFIRGSVDFNKLLKESVDLHNHKNSDIRFEENYEDDAGPRYFVRHVRSEKSEKNGFEKGGGGNKPTIGLAACPYMPIHGDWVKAPYLSLYASDAKELSSHPPVNQNNLSRMYFPSHVQDLINETKFWLTTRAWHKEKHLAWKRGFLLFGKPGTGKTCLVRSLAQDLDLPIFVYELAGMSNQDFVSNWSYMKSYTLCIALLEDFDNVFHGRKNITIPSLSPLFPMNRRSRSRRGAADPIDMFDQDQEQEQTEGGGSLYLNFDVLLNAMDGIEQSDGIFTIITTNSVDKIDPALGIPNNSDDLSETLSTRPGRIDRAIHLTDIMPEHKIAMANWILSEFPEALAVVVEEVKANPDKSFTPSQWQERCSRVALKCKFDLAARDNQVKTV